MLICGRSKDSVEAAHGELQSRVRDGAEVAAVVADVTESRAPARLVEETVERFGGLDILVANAGGPPAGRALEVDDAAHGGSHRSKPADFRAVGSRRGPAPA